MIAKRLSNIKPSGVRKIFDLALDSLRREGDIPFCKLQIRLRRLQ